MARNLEERYSTLPFAERWAYPMLKKPFPDADEASLQSEASSASAASPARPLALTAARFHVLMLHYPHIEYQRLHYPHIE